MTTVELKDALGTVESYQKLKADVAALSKLMEEWAAAPRDEMGVRQPGERQAREIYEKKNKS